MITMRKLILFIMVGFIIVLLITVNNNSMSQNAIQQNIPLETYVGKWYINMTTFPMWLKGDKKNPTFNYTIQTKNEKPTLHGDVQYFNKKGKLKHITGFDKPMNDYNTAFQWRGKGFLWLFKSNWSIIAYHREQQWAIMYFEKTLATPEGYDVFSKQKQLDDKTLETINKKLEELGLKEKLKTLKQE